MKLKNILLVLSIMYLAMVGLALFVIALGLLFSQCRTSINPKNTVFEMRDYVPWAIDNIVISLSDFSRSIKQNMTRMEDGRLHPLSLRITGDWLPDKNIVCR